MDGEIGHVKDLYFDDLSWAVRYVIVNTGPWLTGRLVLISPHAFWNVKQDSDCLYVSLTRNQVENSPPIETHKPVSRQYEEEYLRYYGWPSYWGSAGMVGIAAFPVAPAPHFIATEKEGLGTNTLSGEDPHLRGTQALAGYHIQTHEGAIGHVTDFILDDESWAICRLVVETGHWYSGKEIVISPRDIDYISYEDSKVFVKVSKKSILDAPEYHESPLCFAYGDSANLD